MSEDSDSYTYLSDLSVNDKPWDIHKAFAVRVRVLYETVESDRYADRIRQCAETLEYALESSDEGDIALKLRSTHFCRVRHCPVCQWRRSLKWRAKFFQAMPQVRQDYPTHRWIFLTLTVRNCELADLRETIAHMNKSFARLSQLAIFPAIGWVKALEVTRNAETGESHPHFHVLMLVPAGYFSGKSYINQAEWRELWQKSLRANYLPVVNVKVVKPRHDEKNGKSVDESDAIAIAVCETLKYSVKEEDLAFNAEWLDELTKQLHKTKAIALGGVLRSYLKNESDDDDLVNVDEEQKAASQEDLKIFFGWREMVKRYIKKETCN